jgi:hypothetical protein
LIGYYQSEKTAKFVSNYIRQTHCDEKIGSGFDIMIKNYRGNLVKYTSGKLYIKIRESHHEIITHCDSYEFMRVSQSIINSIDE